MSLRRTTTLSLLTLLLVGPVAGAACSSSDDNAGSTSSSSSSGSGGGDDGGGVVNPDPDASTSASGIAPSLERHGFALGAGTFDVIDITQCCQTSCSGNNPTSPYAAFYVPPAPGQTTPEANVRPDGKSNAYRLRADEAIVFVGKTPPKASYFGFTPYLMDREENPGGVRKPIFASLAETLNGGVIATSAPPGTPPFEQTTAIIAAADATTVANVTEALVEGGVPKTAINVIIFDPAKAHFGLDANADTFGVLFRLALVEDATKKAAFLEKPGGSVWRVTPKSPAAAAAPLMAAAPRAKSTDAKELALQPAVQRLSAAIAAAYPTYESQPLLVTDGEPDANTCIEKARFCAGDNRDTNYPSMVPRDLFTSDDDFYVVFGVDHQVSGKTTYSNFSVYAVERLVGLASIASDQYPGSAQRYLPTDADAPSLYAWKIARACNGEAHCLEIPKGTCPTGIENGALGLIAFRTYLEPSTKTAPDMATLVRDRILRFRKP